MYFRHGLFLPDDFPWPYDQAIAVLHKVAVVNGVSGRVVLSAVPQLNTQDGTNKGLETQIETALAGIYPSYLSHWSPSHLLRRTFDSFPKNAYGPIKYCAACLAETGFVPTIFSLRFMVSCPWHHQPLNPLCERCRDVRQFTPAPFGSPVGYRCEDCGYWVPNRAAIFAACRFFAAAPYESACWNFQNNTERLRRLAVLDVLNFAEVPAEGAQVIADSCAIPEFLPDITTKIWATIFCPIAWSKPTISADECYRNFVRFHQMRLLKAHCTCPCCAVLSPPDFGDSSRSVCVYNAALSIFRQKFEYLSSDETEPRLSEQASQQLERLRMSAKELHRFFLCMFYQLVSRLWFWSRAAPRFVVHIDPRHFYALLDAAHNRFILDRLLEEREPACFSLYFDLPADRTAMRQLLGAVQVGQALAIRNFGTRAELSTSAPPRLFYGSLRATAMFYF
ncbi:hypothetical protein ACQKC8_17855 [Stutzerimonas stutzeri]|uniref:hypothetical protein n=1 Tax=Stutzerimonas stutzeri TaxID=316 RepID=UPI003C2B59B5